MTDHEHGGATVVPEPLAAYVNVVEAEGPLAFVSGQVPIVGDTYEPAPIEEETARCLARIEAVLATVGAGLGDVVRCGVHLADLADFAGMDAAYRDGFAGRPLPARTTVGAQLALGIKVEIDCVARVPRA
ncbi:MAG TPA: RidA family protein [Baekduia sp.]|uniref:RidA family protein n=1 Tax=Baekduia sp. TaxID=2600305 RepID=UPI002D79293E|nr:RidA family protein [Baekduia sp.]HET6505316.1 RidA family protein [Baekduia sp.]